MKRHSSIVATMYYHDPIDALIDLSYTSTNAKSIRQTLAQLNSGRKRDAIYDLYDLFSDSEDFLEAEQYLAML